jgi:hypothetical protein
MKTKFSIVGIITLLLYSCQDKSSSIEEGVETDSLMVTRNMEEQTLRKWFSLNKEADSIIAAAEIISKNQDQTLSLGKEEKKHKMQQKLNDLQFHLEEFKRRVDYIKYYESRTEFFDQSVLHTLDSLKVDYLQEKLKLESAMCEFQEFQVQ